MKTTVAAENPMAKNSRQKMPAYELIHQALKDEILAGVYGESNALPSESQLCQRFQVVRNTVRKALQLLVDENYIVKVPGLGSMIKERITGIPAAADTPNAGDISSPRRNILFITRVGQSKIMETEYFHLDLFNMLAKKVENIGYNLFFKPVSRDFDFADTIQRTVPAAIIFDSYLSQTYYELALAYGLPCVSINHDSPLITSIVSNNSDGAYQVTRELIGKGHRRIAIIAGDKDYHTTKERLIGVHTCLLEQHIPIHDEYFFYGNWLFNSGCEIAEQICRIDPSIRPTAIFAFNDDMAYGSLSYFEKRNEPCLNKISIVGFDNSQRYLNLFPPISTVDINMPTMIEYACWYLLDRLEGKTPTGNAKIQIETTYIDNGTVRSIDSGIY